MMSKNDMMLTLIVQPNRLHVLFLLINVDHLFFYVSLDGTD